MASCAIEACGRFDLDAPGVGLVHGSAMPVGVPTPLRRDRFHCYLCYVMPLHFPAPTPQTLVPTPPADAVRAGPNQERDGEAAHKTRNLAFEKRPRKGPHR